MAEIGRRKLTGWGRTAPTTAEVRAPATSDEVADAIRGAGPRGVIARGLGRSYGDAAQNAGGLVLDLRRVDAIGAIDVTGWLTCGGGVSLDALLRHVVPLGWFVPVTPGTRFVTLGGAVAADVHGKNHHRDGTLGAHVAQVEVVDGRGAIRVLTPADEAFSGVLGGMGLTGVITAVALRLLPIGSAWLAVDTVRTRDLEHTMSTLADFDSTHRYSVAWLDCLAGGAASGRGVVTAGNHLPATAHADPLRFAPRTLAPAPPVVPGHLLGRAQGTVFNAAYYRHAPRHAEAVPTHASSFFHPLDAIAGWNRLYGSRGFVQYQFVTPEPAVVQAVLALLRAARVPGLLAVLKRFGAASSAPLSFPTPGWTLAVDLPARAAGLADTLDAADRLVHASGGRIYLAKDARVRPELLADMYPDLPRWRALREDADPHRIFTSDLARRLAL